MSPTMFLSVMPVLRLELFLCLLSKIVQMELAKAEALFMSKAIPLASAIPVAEAIKAK